MEGHSASKGLISVLGDAHTGCAPGELDTAHSPCVTSAATTVYSTAVPPKKMNVVTAVV